MDENGDKKLSKDDLNNGFYDLGLELSAEEVEAFIAYANQDDDEFLSFDEFVTAIIQPIEGQE